MLDRTVNPALAGCYIVLIEGEHSEGSTARKLLRSVHLLGIDESSLDRLIIVARKAVRIGSPQWEDVERLVAAGLVSDIAIDTLARVAPSDGDSEQAQVVIFDRIAQTIERAPSEETKPTVWVATHNRKGGTGELTDVSGSTQRMGQADTVILTKAQRVDGRVVSCRVTFAKLREEPEEYPASVDFAVTKTGIVCASGASSDDRPLETRILDRLALGAKTKTTLATELGRSRGDIDEAITALFDAREITTASVKVRGREFKAFTLRQNDTGPASNSRRNNTRRTPDVTSPPDDTGRHRTVSPKGGNHAV
ncbi:hypothetical protein BH09MYX1_BH09MYX1_00910 [soil metagenome]